MGTMINQTSNLKKSRVLRNLFLPDVRAGCSRLKKWSSFRTISFFWETLASFLKSLDEASRQWLDWQFTGDLGWQICVFWWNMKFLQSYGFVFRFGSNRRNRKTMRTLRSQSNLLQKAILNFNYSDEVALRRKHIFGGVIVHLGLEVEEKTYIRMIDWYYECSIYWFRIAWIASVSVRWAPIWIGFSALSFRKNTNSRKMNISPWVWIRFSI